MAGQLGDRTVAECRWTGGEEGLAKPPREGLLSRAVASALKLNEKKLPGRSAAPLKAHLNEAPQRMEEAKQCSGSFEVELDPTSQGAGLGQAKNGLAILGWSQSPTGVVDWGFRAVGWGPPGWLVGEPPGWLVGEPPGWLVGEPPGWLVGESPGGLVGEPLCRRSRIRRSRSVRRTGRRGSFGNPSLERIVEVVKEALDGCAPSRFAEGGSNRCLSLFSGAKGFCYRSSNHCQPSELDRAVVRSRS